MMTAVSASRKHDTMPPIRYPSAKCIICDNCMMTGEVRSEVESGGC